MPEDCVDVLSFPMRCAACEKATALPFFAGTTVERHCIRVGMRCRECGHEWRIDMASADAPQREPTQQLPTR
jgi:hypothetical protein